MRANTKNKTKTKTIFMDTKQNENLRGGNDI